MPLNEVEGTFKYSHILTLTGHSRPLNGTCFSDDGLFLAACSDDGTITIWSIVGGKLIETIKPRQGPITVVSWVIRAELDWLFVGSHQGTVSVYKRRRDLRFVLCTVLSVFDNLEIVSMVVNYDATHLSMVGIGRTAVLRVTLDGSKPLEKLTYVPPIDKPSEPAFPTSVVFFNGGKSIMVGYQDAQKVVAYDIDPWSRLWENKVGSRIGSMTWCSKTRALLLYAFDQGLQVWTLHGSELLHHTTLHLTNTHFFRKLVSTAQSGQLAVCGGDDGKVSVFSIDTGTRVQTLRHTSKKEVIQIVSACTSPEGVHFLASVNQTDRPSIVIWSTQHKRYLKAPQALALALVCGILSVVAAHSLSWRFPGALQPGA